MSSESRGVKHGCCQQPAYPFISQPNETGRKVHIRMHHGSGLELRRTSTHSANNAWPGIGAACCHAAHRPLNEYPAICSAAAAAWKKDTHDAVLCYEQFGMRPSSLFNLPARRAACSPSFVPWSSMACLELVPVAGCTMCGSFGDETCTSCIWLSIGQRGGTDFHYFT